MNLSGVDAILFDNDGVLVDSESIHVAVERELLAEMGLIYDHGTYLKRFVGLSNSDFQRKLNQDHQSQFDRPFPSDFGGRLRARVWPRIEAELQSLPGVADLVQSFSGPVAVASSAITERLNRKLEITGLYSLFHPHIYSSDRVANGKPAPDLFLYAAAQLGVAPERCLVIEDSVNGVIAGRAAGMITFGFTGGGHVDEDHGLRLMDAGAHEVIASHHELIDHFG